MKTTGSRALDHLINVQHMTLVREHATHGDRYVNEGTQIGVTVYRTKAGRGTIKEVTVSGFGGRATITPRLGIAKFNVYTAKDDWIPAMHTLAVNMKAEF